MKTTTEPQLAELPVRELRVDIDYHRSLQLVIVNRMVERYEDWLFGVLAVAIYDGGHYVYDGGHRLEAARRLGLEQVRCLVQPMSKESAAELFLLFNTDRRVAGRQERRELDEIAADRTVPPEVRAHALGRKRANTWRRDLTKPEIVKVERFLEHSRATSSS